MYSSLIHEAFFSQTIATLNRVLAKTLTHETLRSEALRQVTQFDIIVSLFGLAHNESNLNNVLLRLTVQQHISQIKNKRNGSLLMMHAPCNKSHHSASNDEALFKRLTQKPPIAYPTVLLFISALLIITTCTSLYFLNELSLLYVILANTIGLYLTFTVLHDASHRAITSRISINDWVGRAAIFLIQPAAPLPAFRYLHMQHHRFVNSEKDPDLFIAQGPLYIRVIKWLFFDIFYMSFYLQSMHTRPQKDRLELLSTIFLTMTLITLAIAYNVWLDMLLVWFLPSRLAILVLSLAFAYLPHYPHQKTQQENPFQVSTIRQGWEWLLTPLMLGQNYHLAHHLYPAVPFYRYRRLWTARLKYHQAQNPSVVSAFGLQTYANVPPTKGNPIKPSTSSVSVSS